MKNLLALGLVVLLPLTTACKTPIRWPFNAGNGAAAQPPPSATQQDAATQGLGTLRQLVTAQNYAALGFTSADQAQQAQLGEPMKVYEIGLDSLKKYSAGTKLADLLTDAHRSMYPIQVDERVLSSLYVNQQSDGYRASVFGDAAIAKAVSSYRSDKSDIIVYVPAAKVYFVGHKTEGGMSLVPAFDDPKLNFKAGQAVPVDQALASLQRATSGYNGLPQ